MNTPSSIYTARVAELTERTAYEAFLLEQALELSTKRVVERKIEDMIFWVEEGELRSSHKNIAYVQAVSLKSLLIPIGMPLLFVTAFKLLDMIIEWCTEVNDKSGRMNFEQKISLWREKENELILPDVMQSSPWLKEALFALYTRLYPFRNVIIHRKTFSIANNHLDMTHTDDGKGGTGVKTNISITPFELVQLADFSESLVQLLQGTLSLESFETLRLKLCIDQLGKLHALPAHHANPPKRRRLIYLAHEKDLPTSLDIKKMKQMFLASHPADNAAFDELVLGVIHGKECSAFGFELAKLERSSPCIDSEFVMRHGLSVQLPYSAQNCIEDISVPRL